MSLVYFCLYTTILSYIFKISVLAESSGLTVCTANDQACVENNANTLYQMIMKGDPKQNIEAHEPLYQDFIEGDLSVLKYKFFNSTFTGMDTCKISNLKWDHKASLLRFDVVCGAIHINGKYEIHGRLIILPVEGEGDYAIDTSGYKMEVECEVETVEGSDGNKHLHIHTYKLKSSATSPIVFKFQNLFNGQKDLSDTLHKFANENWKEVSELVQDPVWYAVAKKIISPVNKYFKLKIINFSLISI